MIENFDRLHGLPDGFFDITTANIRTLFPKPTLIQLDGKGDDFLFISILLHGNEYTGLKVMQKILAEHANDLPRSILMFVGNVRAAEANLRFLPDQVDYNRCWPGTHMEPGPTSQMMARVVMRPTERLLGSRGSMLLVFLVSGLLHEVAITLPVQAGFGLPTLEPTVWGLTALVWLTVGQRFYRTWAQLEA